jgi:hypothetical protein
MRATTVHTRALGLFDAASTLCARGIPIGDILSGGGLFVFDPWQLYPDVIRDPNMFVLGKLGERKSTLVKVYVLRQSAFGRVIRIIDVRGEYLALAEALGGTVIRLSKHGGTRLNPLESPDDRHELLRAVAQAVLPRPLAEREPAILNTALDDVARTQSVPTLPAVIDALMYPTGEMAQELATTPRRLAAEARDVALALQPLCSRGGDLRSMFDGPTTPGLNLTADLVVLDLSDMLNSASEGIVMSCAAAFLQATIDRERRHAETVGGLDRKVIFVIDEAWKVFSLVGLGEWLQTQFKNSRLYGQQNIGIMHRPSDLAAAGDTGSRVVKLVEGLKADCSTFVVFRLDGDELVDAARMLSLSDTEQERLNSLYPGQALWTVGGDERFIVQTAVSSIEMPLVNTDQGMTSPPRRPAGVLQ